MSLQLAYHETGRMGWTGVRSFVPFLRGTRGAICQATASKIDARGIGYLDGCFVTEVGLGTDKSGLSDTQQTLQVSDKLFSRVYHLISNFNRAPESSLD